MSKIGGVRAPLRKSVKAAIIFNIISERTWHLKSGLVAQNTRNSFPGLDSCWHANEGWPIKIVFLVFLEFLENFAVFFRHNQRKHGIYRIAAIKERQSTHEQVVHHMSLSDVWIVFHLCKSPICKIGGRVILVSS